MSTKGFSDGPGKVSKALNIKVSDNGQSLTGNRIWVEDRGLQINEQDILKLPRVGVDYAGKDAKLPYRFIVRDIQETKLLKK